MSVRLVALVQRLALLPLVSRGLPPPPNMTPKLPQGQVAQFGTSRAILNPRLVVVQATHKQT